MARSQEERVAALPRRRSDAASVVLGRSAPWPEASTTTPTRRRLPRDPRRLRHPRRYQRLTTDGPLQTPRGPLYPLRQSPPRLHRRAGHRSARHPRCVPALRWLAQLARSTGPLRSVSGEFCQQIGDSDPLPPGLFATDPRLRPLTGRSVNNRSTTQTPYRPFC